MGVRKYQHFLFMVIRRVIFVLTLVVAAVCFVQAAVAFANDTVIEQNIEVVTSMMTLDQNIGQMTELTIDLLGDLINGEFKLNDIKLHKAIREFKVGSFLNAPGLVGQSREIQQEIIAKIQAMFLFPVLTLCNIAHIKKNEPKGSDKRRESDVNYL